MPPLARACLALGTLAGGAGVLLGAFSAHALRARLAPEMLAVWRTAVEYQFWHALALLAVGLLARDAPGGLLAASGAAFAAGILVFSGSLYALALGGPRLLGALTPAGGLLLLAGWALLALAVLRR